MPIDLYSTPLICYNGTEETWAHHYAQIHTSENLFFYQIYNSSTKWSTNIHHIGIPIEDAVSFEALNESKSSGYRRVWTIHKKHILVFYQEYIINRKIPYQELRHAVKEYNDNHKMPHIWDASVIF